MMLRPYFFLKKKVTKKTFLNRIEAKNAVAFLPVLSVYPLQLSMSQVG